MSKTAGRGLQRYDRQMMIEGFGREGQERLRRAKVVVAGAGGLGCVISIYLTAAGVGKVRRVGHDRGGVSDFDRQVL